LASKFLKLVNQAVRTFFIVKLTFVAFVLIAVCKSSAQSQTYKNQIGFRSDNDAYLGIRLDRYYTNGIDFYFIHALQNQPNNDSSKVFNKIWGANIGQKLFNAHSGKTSVIERVDRPITGYLYGSAYLQILKKNETVYKAELQLGTIGPNALGKQTQEFIHNTLGFYKIDGWQFQLNNAFGVNLDYQKLIYRTKNKKSDFSLPLKLRFGNTFTGFNTAILFRTGRINTLYNSTATQSNVRNSTITTSVNNNEFYFFLKPSLSIVLYDATIQGGLFIANKGPVFYKPIPLVFTQEVGAVYAHKHYTFNASFIYKSREVNSNATTHRYASVGVGYGF
jgi:hypothetical protein